MSPQPQLNLTNNVARVDYNRETSEKVGNFRFNLEDGVPFLFLTIGKFRLLMVNRKFLYAT